MRAVVAATLVASCLLATAHADDKELDRATVVFARGDALYKTDGRGKTETQLAPLPAGAQVRALRTDARGTVLLADLSGKWSWMPLDGSAAKLAPLPCLDGPAQLAPDASCVLCRGKTGAQVIQLATGKATPLAVPVAGARVAGVGAGRLIVWADLGGVFTAPLATPTKKTRVAPEAPARLFLPSHDGTRAAGIYSDFVREGRQQKPADMLMTFALDGAGARRKGIRNGVPLDWSHDNQWVLVQDGGKACLMRAGGGQYKCWKGYTAVSLAPDGSYALVLGPRDKTAAKGQPAPKPADDEPTDEDAGGDPAFDDVAVPPPSGPLSLYRAKLAGPYDKTPELVVKIVDGAAVWVPGT